MIFFDENNRCEYSIDFDEFDGILKATLDVKMTKKKEIKEIAHTFSFVAYVYIYIS